MRLSQLINDLTVLADRVGGSYDVKLRVDDDNSFGQEMTNFWIEERVNDIALVADTAELIYEDEDTSPRIIQVNKTIQNGRVWNGDEIKSEPHQWIIKQHISCLILVWMILGLSVLSVTKQNLGMENSVEVSKPIQTSSVMWKTSMGTNTSALSGNATNKFWKNPWLPPSDRL